MKTVNKNFIYNIVYQLLLYIIPLVLTPYISRTLGAEKIGIYAYTYSIVYYFMLATLLGINNYGSRSIAKNSYDEEKMSNIFSEIYGLQLRIGFIMLIIYNFIIMFIIKQYTFLFFIHNLFLLSAILDINWLYFGIEKFKVTISRNIIIKILSLILIIIFVKKPDDLWIYTLIMALSNFVSQIYLFVILKKYTKFKIKPNKIVLKHLKSCLVLFIPVIAYGIYRVMDKTMIGALASAKELGFYDNSEKIINIPISFLTAMGTVMIPFMSKKSNNEAKINEKIMSSFELCFCIIIPMIFGLIAISHDFSLIYFGNEFEKCGIIIKCLTPSILFASIANIIRTNYLIPFEKDKIYVISTIIGAVINLILNLIFIKQYGALGACIGTIAAEFFVMFYQIICVRKNIDILNMLKILIKYIIKGLIMYIVILIIGNFISNMYIRMISQIIISIIVYFILCRKYIIYDFLGRQKNV